MARSLLHNTAILSILLLLLLQLLHTPKTLTLANEDIEEDEFYILDDPLPSFTSRSRFLTSLVKKGKHCELGSNNICNGVSANKGSGLLYCCKKHCRNVLSDKNNCGQCGQKCNFGEYCCNGRCINVAYDNNNCGKCNRKCNGVPCNYGSCGYA